MSTKEQRAAKSGLTVETLREAVRTFRGEEPVLAVGNRIAVGAAIVCREAFGPDFRDRVGIAIVGDHKGWQLLPRRGIQAAGNPSHRHPVRPVTPDIPPVVERPVEPPVPVTPGARISAFLRGAASRAVKG